jgi:hypothetical protein
MSRGVTMKTPERVAAAQRMRAEGKLLREIGAALGVATSTADQWVNDPDGVATRARKDSYAASCVDCGDPTSGSEGRREEPRCRRCANALAVDQRKIWTPAAVVLAIQEWVAEYGDPPAMADWNLHLARYYVHDEKRAQRYERCRDAGICPSVQSVLGAFVTWNAAIEAAGFEPRANHGGGGNESRRRSARARAAA